MVEPKRPEPVRIFHTIAQTADQLQVSQRTIRRWIDCGELIAHRFGRQFRISQADLDTFTRLRRQGG